MKPQLRRRAGRAHHLDVAPEHALGVPGAKRFHRRFFRGETAGEMGCGIPATRRVGDFPLREDALQKAIAIPADGGGDPINFGGIQPDADNICRHVSSTA